jgi:hypothetical protein
MKRIFYSLLLVFPFGYGYSQEINSTTYPFQSSFGNALEDMGTGTTQLIGPATSGGGSGQLHDIGFDFFLATTRYTQYDVSPNGFIRLGELVSLPTTANNLNSNSQTPCIAPYWDLIFVSSQGKVHAKTIGIAPNRKLVVEWKNMRIPGVGDISTGSATFQVWLSETTGKIEFVYGAGMVFNNANGGYTVGFNRTGINFSSVQVINTVASHFASTNNNTMGIANGRKFAFTPPIPNTPSNLQITNISSTGMRLAWTPNGTTFTRYVIYGSINDADSYQYFTQVSGFSHTFLDLVPGTTYHWKIYNISSGGLSGALEGSGTTSPAATPATTWTGGESTTWTHAANWTNGVPTANSEVIIPIGLSRYPAIEINTTIKSLKLENGATINVANGVALIITGM